MRGMSGVSAAICSMSGISSLMVPRWPLTMHELRAEDDGGVGLAAVGADLQRLRGELLGPVGVAGDLGPQRTHERVPPVEDRLVELLGHRPVDLDAAVHLVDVAGAGRCFGAPQRGPEQQDRVTDPFGADQGVGGPGER